MMRAEMIVALSDVGQAPRVSDSLPALARGRWPGWQVFPAQGMTLAGYCPFDVHLAFLVDNAFAKLRKTTDGSMTFLATGPARAMFTILETGVSP